MQLSFERALQIAKAACKARMELEQNLNTLKGIRTAPAQDFSVLRTLPQIRIYLRNTASMMKAMQQEIDIMNNVDESVREIVDLAHSMRLNLPKEETVNNEQALTLSEAIRIAYEAQDIHGALSAELSRLENNGHCLIGPSGRRGFSSLHSVLKYITEIEESIIETQRKIADYTNPQSGSTPSKIKDAIKRIQSLGEGK